MNVERDDVDATRDDRANHHTAVVDALARETDALTRRVVSMDVAARRTEEELNADLERLLVLQRIGNLISSTFNLEQILRVVSTALVREMGFDRATLLLPVEGEARLVCRTWHGFDAPDRERLSQTLSRLVQKQALETDLPRLHDLRDGRLSRDAQTVLSGWAMRAMVTAPILLEGQLLGGVVAGVASGEIDAHQLEHFGLLIKQASIGIINARLYRRIQDDSRNLESEVSERTRELTTAYRDLQLSRETLVASEKMAFLGQLTAGIAHEINTPIGAVANSLKMLEDLVTELRQSTDAPDVTAEDYREISQEMARSLAVAASAIQKAARFVRSVKAQTRDLANVEVREFDTVQTLDDIRVLLQHELRKNNASVELCTEGSDFRLVGDAGKFSQIFTNLINNAMDAYDDHGGVVVVRVKDVVRSLVVEVCDEGCGISEENQKRLFHQMFTTKWQGRGTGLGLSIVYGLVSGAFAGTINVHSQEGRGTTFTVCLPRRAPAEVRGPSRVAQEAAVETAERTVGGDVP